MAGYNQLITAAVDTTKNSGLGLGFFCGEVVVRGNTLNPKALDPRHLYPKL